jgi:hypothetical protein
MMEYEAELKNPDRFFPLLVLAITVVGALLRMFDIGSKGLWLDEAFSVWMGRQPPSEMLSWLVRIDQHPPLYYLLLHSWMRLGDDAATVRAFSALASALTIPVVYFLGRRLAGGKVGLLGALILALSPFHVRFAQEARMYALLSLNASLALSALVCLLTDPRAATVALGRQLIGLWRAGKVEPDSGAGLSIPRPSALTEALSLRPRGPEQLKHPRPVPAAWAALRCSLRAVQTDLAWGGYVLFTAATLWTHNTALFFPTAVNLFVLGLMWSRRRWPGGEGLLQPPSLRNWMVAQGGVFLLWSPWLRAFVVQAMGIYEEFWLPAPTSRTVVEAIQHFLSAFLPGRIEWAGVIWAMYGAVLLLGAFGLRARPARLLLLLFLFLTPFAGEWLVSLRRPIFYERTLIWASIPLYLLLAVGFERLRYRPYILAALAILATINGLSVREYLTRFEKEQWDDAAAHVAQRAEDGDLILFSATWVQIPFDFYFREWDRPVPEHGVPVDLFERGVLEPKMSASDLPRLRALVRGHDRVWLIYSHDWYTDPQRLIPATLREAFDLLERRRFYGLEVRLYARRSR